MLGKEQPRVIFRIEIESQFPFAAKVMFNSAPHPPAIIPLSRLPSGTEARVLRLDGKADVCQRLREIGFCESAIISRVGTDHALVCQVCGTRVALHQVLGEQIHVEPLGRLA